MGANASTSKHKQPDSTVQVKPEKGLTIMSPFEKQFSNFDNDDDFMFTDSEVLFNISGIERSLHLHYSVLQEASVTLAAMINSKDCNYGSYDSTSGIIKWTYDKAAKDETYRNVLLKLLRYCYGEDQTFVIDEISFALLLMFQLELKNVDHLRDVAESSITELARNSLEDISMIVYSCEFICYDKNDENMTKMIERIKMIMNDAITEQRPHLLSSGSGLDRSKTIDWNKGCGNEKFKALLYLLIGNAIPLESLKLNCIHYLFFFGGGNKVFFIFQ